MRRLYVLGLATKEFKFFIKTNSETKKALCEK